MEVMNGQFPASSLVSQECKNQEWYRKLQVVWSFHRAFLWELSSWSFPYMEFLEPWRYGTLVLRGQGLCAIWGHSSKAIHSITWPHHGWENIIQRLQYCWRRENRPMLIEKYWDLQYYQYVMEDDKFSHHCWICATCNWGACHYWSLYI